MHKDYFSKWGLTERKTGVTLDRKKQPNSNRMKNSGEIMESITPKGQTQKLSGKRTGF